MTTLYDMLDVRPDDDAGTVKEAFRKAVKVCHPDLNADDPKAPARFMEIVRANSILGDPELRAVYDRMLEFEREQHQLASSTYKIVPDAIVVVVLAVVMAGAYTLYTTANIKTGGDAARGAADAATVRPAPPETRIVESPRDEVASAAVPTLGAVAATEKGAVAAEDATRERPADANPAGSARDQVGGAATSVTAALAPAEKDAALTENAAHASGNAAAMQASPPPDANNSGGPPDQHESAQPPEPAAPAADGSAAAKDAPPAPSAITPPSADHAIETAPSHEPSHSAPVKDAQFYRQQGIASYRSGDLPMAIADFDLAIRLDPSLEDAYIDRGIVLYRLHQLDRAFADVAQALRIAHTHRDTAPLPRARPAD